MKREDFSKVEETWKTLGKEDPLWAILSDSSKGKGGWELGEFFRTGREHIGLYRKHLAHFGGPGHFDAVMDFGCGVGRLSQAWAEHADHVTGVDVSPDMIQRAGELGQDREGLRFIYNPAPDLSILPDSSVDLAFSHICLQHMPFALARIYLDGFSRITKPGGWVIFQLPATPPVPQGWKRIRKMLVNCLPFGLSRQWRRLRHGRTVVYDMHFTPRPDVLDWARGASLELAGLVPESEAGTLEGTLYFFRKVTAA